MKRIILFILSTMCLLVLTACGSSAMSESDAKDEVISSLTAYLSQSESVDSIDIIERNTDKEAKTDTILCRIESNDGEKAYVKYFRAVYNHIEKTGWVLDSMNPERTEQWSNAPIFGANDTLINESLLYKPLLIDEDEWFIDEKTFVSMSVASRDTKLDQKSETVIATVILNGDVLSAEGQIQLDFKYDDGWYFSDYRVSTPFTTSVLAHANLELTDNDIIAVFKKHDMQFSSFAPLTEAEQLAEDMAGDIAGEFLGALTGLPFLSAMFATYDESAQSISISEDNVSDFTLLHNTVSDKGTIQTFYSSFALDKGIVKINVLAKIIYEYDRINGWIIQDVGFVPDVISVNIGGTSWSGQGTAFSTSTDWLSFIIEITEQNEDGTLQANLSFPSEQYSCTATGYLDSKRLTISFKFAEWIQSPDTGSNIGSFGASSNYKALQPTLNGYIRVDDISMKNFNNIHRENDFNVTLQ